jgi:hypothetical protein
MKQVYPDFSKRQTYFFMQQIPLQSRKVYNAVKQVIDPMPEKSFNFTKFMNQLFFSKDILLRTGYFHLKIHVDKKPYILNEQTRRP